MEELLKIVGDENYSDDPEDLKRYSKDYSLLPPRMPNCIVKPRSVEEIREVVKVANKLKMPIIPCSSGIHFYGNTIPSLGGIILDLSKMNRILEVDERNRKARIEPGVTWGQLQGELRKYDLMALNPLLPHKLKSALTSHLEREPMLIPKFEYSEPVITMEVVLPNGEVFRTGSASVPNALSPEAMTDLCNPYGPGIDFFRLFQGAQGTLGVVTWMNIKVEYLPKIQKIFFIQFKTIRDVIEPLYTIQRSMIGNECLLLNNFNLANIISRKWPDDFEKLKGEVPPFTLILVLAGGRRRPEEKIEYEEEALMKISSEFKLNISTNFPGGSSGAEKLILNMLRSEWPDEPYWKFRVKGASHDIFFLTTLDKVTELSESLFALAEKFNYPREYIGFYLQPLERGRIAHCEYNFYYDPENPEEVENLRNLNIEAVEYLTSKGAFFSRPYGEAANIIYGRCAAYTMALKKVKAIFDPNNIMNPGKLCF